MCAFAGLNAGRVTLGKLAPRGVTPPRFIPKSAAAMEVAALPQMTDAERAELAEKLGYRSIGAELPDEVTLQDVIKSLPSEVSRQRVSSI